MQDHSQPRRLTRGVDRKVGGVCGGLAEYFGIEPTFVRIGFAVLTIITFGPAGLFAYAVLWAIMPEPDPNAPPPRAQQSANGALLLGIVLLLVGVSMAINGLQLLWWMTTSMLRFGWPAVLITAGIFLVVVASRRR
ncbi:MAG: PspC domain-containing protein [Chloroflexota bacterium]